MSPVLVCSGGLLDGGLRIRSIVGSRGECAAFDAAASEMVNVDDRLPGRGESEKRKQFFFSFTNRAGTAQKRGKQYTVYEHTLTPILRVSLPEPIRLSRGCLP